MAPLGTPVGLATGVVLGTTNNATHGAMVDLTLIAHVAISVATGPTVGSPVVKGRPKDTKIASPVGPTTGPAVVIALMFPNTSPRGG